MVSMETRVSVLLIKSILETLPSIVDYLTSFQSMKKFFFAFFLSMIRIMCLLSEHEKKFSVQKVV